MLGAGWAVGYEADGAGEQQDADPTGDGEVFMQPETAEQRDHDVAEGGGRHDEGQVGPGQSDHIAGEESDQEDDAGDDVQVEDGVKKNAEVVRVDGGHLAHPALEKCVAE